MALCGVSIGNSSSGQRCTNKVSRKVYRKDGTHEKLCCGNHLKMVLKTSFDNPNTAIVVKINDTPFGGMNINPYLQDVSNIELFSSLSEKDKMYYTSSSYLMQCDKLLKFNEFDGVKPDLRYFARLYPKYIPNTSCNSDEENCSICCDPITSNKGTLERCHHSFHKSCLEKWFVPSTSKSTSKCPNCFAFIIPELKSKKNKTTCKFHKKELKYIL